MNNDDGEEEINPWTFRNNKSPRRFQEHATTKTMEMKKLHYSPAKLMRKNKEELPQYSSLPKTEVLKYLRFPAIVQTKFNSNELFSSSKIKNYRHILTDQARSKFLPNNQKIKISMSSQPKQKNSGKIVPYYIKSLRQYTQNHQILKRKTSREEEVVQKRRRFKTEEPQTAEKEKEEIKRSINKADFDELKVQSIKSRNNPTIKIINISKKQEKETVISQGKLYNDLSHLCDIRGELNSKLSLMKRTYNLKKIQKMISEQ